MVGCLALSIAAINRGMALGKQVMREAKVPITRQQLAINFKEVPFYPNATVDTDEEFRRLRAGIHLLSRSRRFDDIEVALLITSDPAEQVITFYQKQMAAIGYTERDRITVLRNNDQQFHLEFYKDRNRLNIEVIKPATDAANRNAIITLMRSEEARR
jgi:hypothetical protein